MLYFPLHDPATKRKKAISWLEKYENNVFEIQIKVK